MLADVIKEKLDTELLERLLDELDRLDGAPNWKIDRWIRTGVISENRHSKESKCTKS